MCGAMGALENAETEETKLHVFYKVLVQSTCPKIAHTPFFTGASRTTPACTRDASGFRYRV